MFTDGDTLRYLVSTCKLILSYFTNLTERYQHEVEFKSNESKREVKSNEFDTYRALRIRIVNELVRADKFLHGTVAHTTVGTLLGKFAGIGDFLEQGLLGATFLPSGS